MLGFSFAQIHFTSRCSDNGNPLVGSILRNQRNSLPGYRYCNPFTYLLFICVTSAACLSMHQGLTSLCDVPRPQWMYSFSPQSDASSPLHFFNDCETFGTILTVPCWDLYNRFHDHVIRFSEIILPGFVILDNYFQRFT